jgi:hypothetical protein
VIFDVPPSVFAPCLPSGSSTFYIDLSTTAGRALYGTVVMAASVGSKAEWMYMNSAGAGQQCFLLAINFASQ